jgi:hypothetical protein
MGRILHRQQLRRQLGARGGHYSLVTADLRDYSGTTTARANQESEY